ncbi:Rpn family recombination-promoting nuclease/putative transposase [Treponema sp. OMZ 840]|uniref:Rpn family recombination-promoting nuclease/putative transposase n=1 Tax=Treponema sp. OMZ 840 TaxID=244313 RepID=UPI003D8DA121
MTKANPKRTYKDSVFADFFGADKSAKSNFISLYNALHGTQLPLDCELRHIRLEQILYMNFYNDVSFLVDNKIIVLAEHQSTVNENMPFRFLEYVVRLYEQIQNPRDKYLRRLVKIPSPEFYVFYNGEEDFPEYKTLKLSDAFMTAGSQPNLELIVEVVNINQDKAHTILEQCKPLAQYSLFVETVRKHLKLDREKGFEKAVQECINNDILREYLERKSREVMNMLLAEYDYATDIAVQREEEREIALEEGARQKALETAAAFKRLGVELDTIAAGTGLTREEIEKL